MRFSAWRGGLIAAALLFAPAAFAAPKAQPVPGVTLPLATDGPRIVDQDGRHVRLLAVNWFGAESGEFVVGGLDKQPLDTLAKTIRDGGFNTVRLPWSNELVERDPVVEARYLSANPALKGKTAMAVFDAVVDALGREGLMVILDNHRSRGDWCCDETHGDGLWHTPAYPESAWIADWKAVAARYADRPFVIAAELRNEIRPDPPLGLKPSWGGGDLATGWRAAAMRGGEAVLAVDPRLLIVVGGIGYQTQLGGVRDQPATLSVPRRLVYAAHDYAWNRTADELRDPALFARRSMERWDFVRQPGQAFTAPVLISEFGGCAQLGPDGKPCAADRLAYPLAFARYAQASGVDFAWWPLNGTQSAGYNRKAGEVEAYGLLKPDWSGWADPGLVAALTGKAAR
jgi:endoglucanase